MPDNTKPPSDQMEIETEEVLANGMTTRQKILDVARKMISQEGLGAVSMRKIGKKVGISQVAIYRHFADKNELVAQIIDEGYQRLVQNLRSAADKSNNPAEFIPNVIKAYVDFALADPNFYKAVMFSSNGATRKQVNSLSPGVARTRDTFRLVNKILEDGMAQGIFREGDSELLSQSVWMAVFGIASRMVLEPELPIERKDLLLQNAVEIILYGLVRR